MIFRQVALDRLTSPEQLDQLMKVTRPTGWMALGSLAMILLSALVWGIFGSLPEKAPGMGILVRTGGVFEIPAVGGGRLLQISIKPGDMVQAGSVVGRIHLPDLEEKVRIAEKNLRIKEGYYQKVLSFQKHGEQLDTRDQTSQGKNFRSSIQWYAEQVKILEERLVVQEELLSEGLISRETALSTRQSLAETRRQRDSASLELERIDVNRLKSDKARTQEILKSAQEVAETEHQMEEMTIELRRKSQILSTNTGRVLEVFFYEGQLMNPGDSLLSLEEVDKKLFATIWIPAGDGKGVSPGMAVQLVPSGVKQEEFGFLLGKVIEVSQYPSTTRAMKSLLENDVLVQAIGKQGPSVQVEVDLTRNAKTPSGYQWTSWPGPAVKLTSGTVCGANVITRTMRPISLVIPKIRKTLGI